MTVEIDTKSLDHFSDAKEDMGSARNETKTGARRGHEENNTESTKAVSQRFFFNEINFHILKI